MWIKYKHVPDWTRCQGVVYEIGSRNIPAT